MDEQTDKVIYRLRMASKMCVISVQEKPKPLKLPIFTHRLDRNSLKWLQTTSRCEQRVVADTARGRVF